MSLHRSETANTSHYVQMQRWMTRQRRDGGAGLRGIPKIRPFEAVEKRLLCVF